jgi:mRNA-degrading endonuclease RelE of RelBE toxin-antitoxin system
VEQSVTYPGHHFSPEDLLTFVQTSRFSKKWDKDFGLTDEDRQALEILIMLDPKRAPVIQNSGGLRKVRFSGRRMNRGRRDALRICYVYFEEFGIVLLLNVYAKNEQDDLTEHEKAQCRALIEQATNSLRGGRCV